MGQILGPKCACKKSAHGHWAALFSTHSMSFQRERFTSKPRASTQCPRRAAFFRESVLRISFWILDFCICCRFCVPLFLLIIIVLWHCCATPLIGFYFCLLLLLLLCKCAPPDNYWGILYFIS